MTHFGLGMLYGSVSAVALSHTDNSVDDSNGTASYTFSTQSIGTAGADRKIVVCVSGSRGAAGTHTVASLTVAGNSASLVKQQNVPSGDRETAEIWAVDVASGTTGDIVVTFDATMNGCGIGVFAIYGAGASAHATAGSSADPMNASIDVPAGGVLIGAGKNMNGGTFSWTNLTEKFDEEFDSGPPGNHTGAADEFASAQTALSVTCDPSAAGSDNAMALASWGPA